MFDLLNGEDEALCKRDRERESEGKREGPHGLLVGYTERNEGVTGRERDWERPRGVR